MATTTPNNGWPVPTSTDYVKDGATAIESLGDAIDTSVGEGLLAWQSWAPTFTGGWANGNGTWDAKYVKIGKTVHFRGLFTAGSTSTMGSGMIISRPVTASNIIDNNVNVLFIQSTTRFAGFPLLGNTTTMTIGVSLANATYVQFGAISATAPFTWATGNLVYISGTYEAA